MENKKIHTTIGLYLNGDYKINGVSAENLDTHIEYNKTLRFGRALFVDGKCVHEGYYKNSPEEIADFEKRIADNPEQFTRTEDTAPYH